MVLASSPVEIGAAEYTCCLRVGCSAPEHSWDITGDLGSDHSGDAEQAHDAPASCNPGDPGTDGVNQRSMDLPEQADCGLSGLYCFPANLDGIEEVRERRGARE